MNRIVPYIRQHEEAHISVTQVEGIFNTLVSANVADKTARKQHVTSVKQNQARRDSAVSNGKCPRCGGNLFQRDGRYGRFYGCSNYPRCKYTLN